jgi:hypothetical protein
MDTRFFREDQLEALSPEALSEALWQLWGEEEARPDRDAQTLLRAGAVVAEAGFSGVDDVCVAWVRSAELTRARFEVLGWFCAGYWRAGGPSEVAIGFVEATMDGLPRACPEWTAPLAALDTLRGRASVVRAEVLGRVVARVEAERRVLDATGLHPEALGRLSAASEPVRPVPLIDVVPIHLLLESARGGGPCEVLADERTEGTGWESVRVLLGYGDRDTWLTFAGPTALSLSEDRLRNELARLSALREAVDDAITAVDGHLAFRRSLR